jgi:hypothetical protein
MNDDEWMWTHRPSLRGDMTKVGNTHRHLKPTLVKIPPYARFVVPFAGRSIANTTRSMSGFCHPLRHDTKQTGPSEPVFVSTHKEPLTNEAGSSAGDDVDCGWLVSARSVPLPRSR